MVGGVAAVVVVVGGVAAAGSQAGCWKHTEDVAKSLSEYNVKN